MEEQNEFKDGKYLTAKAKYALLVIGLIVFFAWLFGFFNWVEQPGSAFEKDSYSGVYYILAFPSKDSVKNYKIPGHISRVYDRDGEDSYHYYQLESMDFPNGGSPTFSECYPNLKTKTLCTTDSEDQKDFYIQMTNEGASTK